MDKEVRDFIDELYFANYVEYKGKLRLAIRRNIDKINEFIEERDNQKYRLKQVYYRNYNGRVTT